MADGENMLTLTHGSAVVELRPFVEEAIAALGLVRPTALQWLEGEIAKNVNRSQGRSIRENGARLTADRRAALGVPGFGGHLSEEVWEALTDTGRTDPVRAFDDTVARAIKLARNAAQRLSADRSLKSGLFAGVKIGPSPSVGLCASGMAMVGKVLDAPPVLPFTGCDQSVCSCSWRLITHWELEHR